MKAVRIYLLALVTLGGVASVMAQKTQIYLDNERALKEGVDLYQRELYADAQSVLSQIIKSKEPISLAARSQADYYYAACAVELFHNNAEYLMKQFIQKYPESDKVVQAHFQLGKLYFRTPDYKNAIAALKKTDVFLLDKRQFFEYYYKLGYSYYNEKELDQAHQAFNEVKNRKQKENLYQEPAKYYSAHIFYEKGNLENALNEFLELKESKAFGKIVPFYIAQIYYRQQKYEETIEYATPIADTLKSDRLASIYRILAESHYELKHYPDAVTYFENYMSTGKGMDREANYHLGLSYYFTSNCAKAVRYLENASSAQDSLSQSAYYYAADCYIKQGEKMKAIDALKLSYSLDFNPKISEEALYNFSLLSYELGYNPYNQAIDAINLYIQKYPNSIKINDAYELLVDIYMQTNNYEKALESLERIKNKNSKLKFAEQRIYLFRGIELFNAKDYEGAVQHFEKTITNNLDSKVTAEAKFWKADANYQLGKFKSSATDYNDFLNSAGAKDLKQYNDAYYNLAYAYIKQKNYNQALVELRAFVQTEVQDQRKLNDAYLRMGDCAFMAKNYEKAVEYYEKAIQLNKIQTDYAMLQKGIILGLQRRQQEKVQILEKASTGFPNSNYRNEIHYELGLAYTVLNQNQNATRSFLKVVEDKRNNEYNAKAYLQLALIYFSADNYDEALVWNKRTVSEFPNTSYSNVALLNIRNIYIEQNRLAEYRTYIENVPSASVTQGSLDSATFEAARKDINAGLCDKIIAKMTDYLNNFPSGIFYAEANYNLGDCYVKNKTYDLAIPAFEKIIEKNGKSMYDEDALVRVGDLYIFYKDWDNAIRVYELLRIQASTSDNLQLAEKQLMRSYFQSKNYERAASYANTVLTHEKIGDALLEETNYILANSYFRVADYDQADKYYKKFVAKTSSFYYPEAAYRVGEIMTFRGEYKEAEKHLRTAIKSMGGQPEWMAQTFILLSDIYISLGNTMEAKAVLQTLLNNYEGEELLNVAQQKMERILAIESENNTPKQEEPQEFDLQPEGK